MSARFDPDLMPARIAKLLSRQRSVRTVAGVNDDDCAVFRFDEPLLVVSTDFLNANPIASQLGLATLSDLGRLLVLSNLADLCGSGANPLLILLGITMERSDTDEDFLSFVEGAQSEAAKWGVELIGGDSKIGPARAFLAVVIGSAGSEENLFLKNRAKVGDFLWCSGEIGGCNAAVLGLSRGILQGDYLSSAKRAILSPELPLRRSRSASSASLGRGGVDISDGFGVDLNGLCDASGVGVTVMAERIPVNDLARHVAREFEFEPWQMAFGCGGDCQFLMTSEPQAASQLAELGFTHIGEITSTPRKIVKAAGREFVLPKGGHRDARGKSFYDEILLLIGESTI